MRCGLALLEVCAEVVVCGTVSDGVRREIEAATQWGIPVRFRKESR